MILSFTIYVLTGGIGAGKSTFSKFLDGCLFPQADIIRRDLHNRIPEVKWFNRSQEYKDTPHSALGGRTPRALLIEEAEKYVATHGLGALASANIRMFQENISAAISNRDEPWRTFIVDDVRRMEELNTYRRYEANYPGVNVVHIHLDGGLQDTQPTATPLEEFRAVANYVITRKLPLVRIP